MGRSGRGAVGATLMIWESRTPAGGVNGRFKAYRIA